MEFVGGGCLTDRLAAGPLPPRDAAELVETLARAMHYAHQQGVIHRDLKPANVLLTACGLAQDEARPQAALLLPKISDFGLAKHLDAPAGQTRSGAIVGTPSYMAPEQAAGLTAAVGPAADVYALGAILYECLTGRPPFRAATALETLEQVRTQDPVPPRRLQPKVPRELDTICSKCLRKAPPDRYVSAGALAEDLRRFRDGAPIRARPVPLWERAWKWARRRPAAAGLMALGGLAVAAGLVGLWLHTTSLDAQVRRAELQKRRADTNYQQARQAINQMLARLDKFHASGVPQVEALRRDLRQNALTFFEGIAAAEADAEPAIRFDVAQAYLVMVPLLNQQGQSEAARAKLDRARLLLQQLIADDLANQDYQAELAKCFDLLANSAGGEEGLRFREQALAVRQALCRAQPDNAAWQRALAVSHINMGVSYYGTGRLQRAEPCWQEAVRLREKLAREYPEEAQYQFDLAVSYSNLALLYANTDRHSEADALYRKCEPLLTELVRNHPHEKPWSFALVQTLRVWGALLNTARRAEEARAPLGRAIQIMDEWLREDPLHTGVQELLLGCLVARMNNSTLLHLWDEGDKDWQRGLALSAQLKTWNELCIGALWDARFEAHALAVARAEHLAKQPGLTSANRFELVKAYSQAAQAARKDRLLPPTEQGLTAERYARQAVQLLDQARQDGLFKDPALVEQAKKEPDLDPLRSWEDFQKLMHELAGQ
jgi:tetratricopeptide (TPR) repeat protein